MTLPVLLLAAGQSSRMRGQDKLMEMIGGVPLIRRQAQAALAAGLDVTIALPALDHPRALVIADLPVTARVFPESAEGMGGTLRAGVAVLPPAPHFMILLADLPEMTTDDLATMAQAARGDAQVAIWQGADHQGNAGHPVVFADRLRDDFANLAGDLGAKPVIKANLGARRLVTLPDLHATRDLDTPEEWAAWRAETGVAS